MTCWTPLVPCGDQAPGLECIPGSAEEFEHKPEGPWEQGLNVERVARLVAERGTVVPILYPGDVVLFGEHTLHRTHLTPSMTAAA